MTTRPTRRWPGLILLLLLAVTTGCGGASTEHAAVDAGPRESSGAGGSSPEAAEESSDGDGTTQSREGGKSTEKSTRARPSIDQRAIIRTGSMSVRTKRPEQAADRAENLISGTDGFVGERTKNRYPGGERVSVELTLRVPVDKFDSVREAIAEYGKVTEDRHEATDVTDQVVDVQSRIENQQRSIDRLRRLMAEAKDVGEIIQIESELETRESDLESLQARQESLGASANLSTLTVTFSEPAPKPDRQDDEDQLGFLVGLRDGTQALLATGTVILTALGAITPFLPVLLLGGAVIWWLWRRLRGRPAT